MEQPLRWKSPYILDNKYKSLKKFLIIGERQSGKTELAKYLASSQ